MLGAKEEVEDSGAWGDDWGDEPKLSQEELKNFDYANTNLNKCSEISFYIRSKKFFFLHILNFRSIILFLELKII